MGASHPLNDTRDSLTRRGHSPTHAPTVSFCVAPSDPVFVGRPPLNSRRQSHRVRAYNAPLSAYELAILFPIPRRTRSQASPPSGRALALLPSRGTILKFSPSVYGLAILLSSAHDLAILFPSVYGLAVLFPLFGTQFHTQYAGMMELADMQDLGSCASRRWGSNPHARTSLTTA